MNIAKSSLKVFATRILSSIFSFLAVIIFSRGLGASPLGTYYPFLALLGLLVIPADFGISKATEKRISEGKDEGKYLAAAIIIKILPITLISLLLLISRDYVALYLGSDLTLWLIVILFTEQIAQLSVTVLRAELRVGEAAVVELYRPLAWLCVGYILYSFGYGLQALVGGYFVGTLLILVSGWWKVSISINFPEATHIYSLLDYGRFSVVSSIGGYFYSWMDVAMLSGFVALGVAVTRSEIGAYENAWRLSLIAMLLSQSVATVLFPQVSQWSAEGALDRIEDTLPTAFLPSILIVIPAFFGTIVLSRDLLRILFGPEFTVAWLVLIILTGEKILQSIHVILGRSLQAIDRPDLAAYATAISIMVNLLLNVMLIWKFGLVGAAVATTISFAVNTVLHAHYLNQFLQINFPTQEAVWSVFAALVMGAIVYFVRAILHIDTIIGLIGIVVFGAVVYTGVVLIYSPIRETVQQTIRPIVENSRLY